MSDLPVSQPHSAKQPVGMGKEPAKEGMGSAGRGVEDDGAVGGA